MSPSDFTLRLRLLQEDSAFFGPGVDRLLNLVEETGSLQMAADKMQMSYSKALRIVRAAEKAVGFAFLERHAGGAGGGFSRLTDRGRAYMDRYEAFVAEVRNAAEASFCKYFQEKRD